MKESQKKSRKEPVFLLEMPHPVRHLIMKRGQMLRSGRTRTLFCMGKGGPKSWLQAKLIPSPGESPEESWDKAHELAGKFQRELHTDVYVEPGSRAGRYQSIVAPMEGPGSADNHQSDHPSMMSGPVARSGFGPGPVTGVSGIGGGFGHGVRSPMGFGAGMGADMSHSGRMGHPNSGLPPEVEALMSNQQAASRSEVTCPALRQLPGWSELPTNKQLMFEAEAAQLIKNGLTLDTIGGLPQAERSTLELVRLQPNLSKMLKHFLNEALITPAAG